MTFFTVIGLLWFWWVCWEVGYHIALACDAKARLDSLLKPMESEVEAFIAAFPIPTKESA